MINDLWEKNIDSAKILVNSKVNNQMEIARLALECCEIKHGGSTAHKESLYTLTRFAEEIGVSYNTLQTWVIVRKNVFDKISDNDKYSVPYTTFQRMTYLITADSHREDVTSLFKERVAFSDQDERVATYISAIRSLCSNLLNENKRSKCNVLLLEEAAFYTQLLGNTFKNLKIDPKNNELLMGHDRGGSRASHINGDSLTISGLVLSNKDRIVIGHIVSSSADNFTFTQVGRATFPSRSKMAAKLAVLRTFYKLCHFDYLKKDKKSYTFTTAAKKKELSSLIRRKGYEASTT